MVMSSSTLDQSDSLQLDLFENFPDTDHSEYSLGHEQIGNWCDNFGDFIRTGTKHKSRPRILSLFSGAGGLDIGFFDAGFEIVEKVEIEEQFVKTLEANSGEGRYFSTETQVTCIDITEYVAELNNIDFIIGGPPCQSFSAAGARASGVAGTNDERGNLFQQYVRLLDQLQPKGFLFENVYRIVGANGGKDWNSIIQAFANVGYLLKYRILDTADYGTPQHRERLIIVGLRRDITKEIEYRFPRPTHGPDAITGLPYFSANAAIQGVEYLETKNGINGRYGHLLNEIPPGLNYSFFTEKMGHPQPVFAWRSKFSDFLYKADPSKPVRTIKAQGGQYTGPFHWENRPFTIPEMKRLQTFPDRYILTGSKIAQIKQIGNSVPPQFARVLALSVAEQVFQARLPVKLDYLRDSEELSFPDRKRQLTAHYSKVAKEAISNLLEHTSSFSVKSYMADLPSDLSWQERESGGEFIIKENVTDGTLTIEISTMGSISPEQPFTVEITPTQSWFLPFNAVILKLSSFSERTYTAAWKAFEAFLIHNSLKADLVQLAGYYQYKCAFKCSVNFVGQDKFLAFVAKITEGLGINQQLTGADIQERFDLPQSCVLPYLIRLKEMGFEVRSNQTNGAIQEGNFLLPYCFPTLTEKSVQRSKSLV